MIGKKIETLIEAAGLKKNNVAQKLGITYQNLNRIFKKDSIETSYLFKFAEILNVPVVLFFEDEPGGLSPAFDVEKLLLENKELHKTIKELTEQLNDKRLLTDFFLYQINDLITAIIFLKQFTKDDFSFDISLSDDDVKKITSELSYTKEKAFLVQQFLAFSKNKMAMRNYLEDTTE